MKATLHNLPNYSSNYYYLEFEKHVEFYEPILFVELADGSILTYILPIDLIPFTRIYKCALTI